MTDDVKNIFFSTSIEETKVYVDDLKIGMYVSRLDKSWMESSFLFQGFELKTQTDINEVKRQCLHVFVDETKQSKDVVMPQKHTAYSKDWLEKSKPRQKHSTFKREFSNAEKVHQKTSGLVKSFMEEVALGRAINVEMAKTAVSNCVQSIMNSPDALMWLTQLKNKDEYTSQHSMNVCVFSISLGRQIGLPDDSLEELGLCGMMHDIGKMKIPLEVLNKPGRLTPKELTIMQSHPTVGWKLLVKSDGMPGSVIDAAYGHHEAIDGSGYPRGLSGNRISPYTKIVAIADTYDAISSDRIYRKGKTHLEAISIMTKISGTQLDGPLVIKFIESLGIYPPGNIIEMTNGEVAIVIETNNAKKLKPKITMLLDENKKPVKPRLVDLSKMGIDLTGKSYAIKRIVRVEEYNIDLELLHKMGLIRNSAAA